MTYTLTEGQQVGKKIWSPVRRGLIQTVRLFLLSEQIVCVRVCLCTWLLRESSVRIVNNDLG